MVKVNFRNFPVYTDITHKHVLRRDMALEIADLVYTAARGIVAHALSLKIYHSEGEIELSEDEVAILKKLSQAMTPIFVDSLNDALTDKETENE